VFAMKITQNRLIDQTHRNKRMIDGGRQRIKRYVARRFAPLAALMRLYAQHAPEGRHAHVIAVQHSAPRAEVMPVATRALSASQTSTCVRALPNTAARDVDAALPSPEGAAKGSTKVKEKRVPREERGRIRLGSSPLRRFWRVRLTTDARHAWRRRDAQQRARMRAAQVRAMVRSSRNGKSIHQYADRWIGAEVCAAGEEGSKDAPRIR